MPTTKGMNVAKNKGKGMDRKQDFLRSTHFPVALGTSHQSTSTHSDEMRIVQQGPGR